MTESQGPGGRIVRRGPYPEFTWTALLLGYGIGILIRLGLVERVPEPGRGYRLTNGGMR